MKRDLGTYHVRVILEDGRGFIMQYETGARYEGGSGSVHPLDAKRIGPIWENEADLFGTIAYQFFKGNYSCDCNLKPFLALSLQESDLNPLEVPCGETVKVKSLTAIRPDGSEAVIQ